MPGVHHLLSAFARSIERTATSRSPVQQKGVLKSAFPVLDFDFPGGQYGQSVARAVAFVRAMPLTGGNGQSRFDRFRGWKSLKRRADERAILTVLARSSIPVVTVFLLCRGTAGIPLPS